MTFARRLDSAQPSPTLALNAKAKALAAQGVDVVGFAAGEPDFDTPQFIKDAAVQALNKGQTKYTATAGTPELRSAIAEKLRRENDLTYAPDQILASCGAKHSLYNFFQALLNEGDEVVIFSPYWVSYPEMVMLAGGKPVIVPTKEENGFAPDPALLKKALTPKTKAVIINSPSNPTGAVLSAETLKGIAEAIKDHSCWVVTDDIYERLLYVPGPFQNILNVAPNLKERTVVVNGFSKAFSMTGWRLGYAAGPKSIISAMQLIQDQSTSNPSSITQAAGVAALQGPREPVEEMVKEFKARRDLFVAALNALPGVRCSMPGGAFYLMPNFSSLMGKKFQGKAIEGSVQLSTTLLEHFQLAAVPGQPFGAENYLRFSFATSRQTIDKGLTRLRDFIGQLT
jgi:aspartate aminotransferase